MEISSETGIPHQNSESPWTENSDEDIERSIDVSINIHGFHEKIKIWENFKNFNINSIPGQMFKPADNDKNSLYYQLLINPENALNISSNFIQKSGRSPVTITTYYLYKFILNCTTHHKYSLKLNFKYPPDPAEILTKAERFNYKHGYTKNMFMIKTKSSTVLKTGIMKFFEQLILDAYKQDLLFKDSFNFVFQLLDAMCKNKSVQFILTSITFVMHTITALCIIKTSIDKDSSQICENQFVDDFINNLYLVLKKYCSMYHSSLAHFKIDFSEELSLWIHYCPGIFIDYFNCISVIHKFLHDSIPFVRKAALHFSQNFLNNEANEKYLNHRSVKQLAIFVVDRFNDVDDSVALKALEVYCHFIRRNFDIKDDLFKVLIKIVYNEDYKKGTVAAKCLMEFIKHDEDTEILIKLCKFSNTYPNLKPAFVESFSDHAIVLQNWKLFVNLYYTENDINTKIILSELLFQSVNQVVKGKSTMMRKNSKINEVCDLKEQRAIAAALCPALKFISVTFRDTPVIPQNYYRALSELSEEIIKENILYIKEFISFFGKLFKSWNDQDVLKALLKFVEQSGAILQVNEDFLEYLTDYYKNDLLNLDVTFGGNYEQKLDKLNMLISSQMFSTLLNCADLQFFEITGNIHECIEEKLRFNCWLVIRKIQALHPLTYSEQQNQIAFIEEEIDKLNKSCLQLMEQDQLALKLKGYNTLLKNSNDISTELENISKQMTVLNKIKPTFAEDSMYEKRIVEIFELTVAHTEISLTNKYEYAKNLVLSACHEVFSMGIISNLLMFYESYYDVYGELINDVLTKIHEKEENWVPMLAVNAVALCYKKYEMKLSITKTLSAEGKSILKLCRKLAAFKLFSDDKSAFMILFYSINYAIDHDAYNILTFVAVFSDCLKFNISKCSELLKYFQQKVPTEYMKHDIVLYFSSHLKSVISSEKTKKKIKQRQQEMKTTKSKC
ncbi:uncharacterized protein LOC143192442 [Rhynchophorus ferrugineus]|uniref:uncharacterized protein LOC143192442 n=1 Tax=Rhynchophorus ferrugineus TaxID=354439 RepID=UPI003FCCB0CB